jgi:CO/xanthine dehydrogenase FAD-binding subunit
MEAETRPLGRFDYVAPSSLMEVIDLLGKYGNEAKLLAGGTDLVVWMKKRSVTPSIVIDTSKVQELSFIEERGELLHIGAGTRLNDIKRSEAVQAKALVLAQAIGQLASYPIRNRATLGGNLCSASPAADTAPALLVLGATAILQGPRGERAVPLAEFFIGPGQTARSPTEILREVAIGPSRGRSAFIKLGRRKGFTLSIASAAGLAFIEGGTFKDVKLALGAVAPIPLLSKIAEQTLKGKTVSEEGIARTAEQVKEEVNPITDVRASASYRREMAGVLARRILTQISVERG